MPKCEPCWNCGAPIATKKVRFCPQCGLAQGGAITGWERLLNRPWWALAALSLAVSTAIVFGAAQLLVRAQAALPALSRSQPTIAPVERATLPLWVRPTRPTSAAPSATLTRTSTMTRTSTTTSSPTATAAPKVIVVQAVTTERTYFEVRLDGAVDYIGIVEAGQARTWTAREKAELRVGNAGGTRLVVNGVEIPPLGKSGQVVDVAYTLDTLPARASPRP